MVKCTKASVVCSHGTRWCFYLGIYGSKGRGQKEGLAQHVDSSIPSGGFWPRYLCVVGSQAACTQTTTRLEKQTSGCESIASWHLESGLSLFLCINKHTRIYYSVMVWNGASQVTWWLKNLPAYAGDAGHTGLIPRWGEIPWRREWQPTPVFLPGDSYGQRSLAGPSP